MGLNIIFEDEQILVVKKDAGIPVEAGRLRIMDLQGLIKNELYRRNRKGGEPYLGLIHRLDQPVEGVMVFAKTPFAAGDLSEQVRDGRTNTSSVVRAGEKDAKRSELNYKVLKRNDETTLVGVELITGRHHQIRVQMANAGWPLYGDTKYNPQFQETSEYVQTALCAYKLSFVHPKTKKVMEFMIEPDNSMLKQS